MKSKIHMLNINQNTEGLISNRTLSCKVVSGRQVRFNNIVNPTRHRIFWLKHNSPLVSLVVSEAHGKHGCGLCVQEYVNACQLIGVSVSGLHILVEEFQNYCPGCLHFHIFSKTKVLLQRQYFVNMGRMIVFPQRYNSTCFPTSWWTKWVPYFIPIWIQL